MTATAPNQRFLALDVFRGMTICFMIIVNTPGGPAYSPLEHAKWSGFTPTDLVFPSFLFAVGNAMSFVMRKWETLPQGAVVGKILKRTLIIFLCGYLMYWFPFYNQNIANTRILGVLQRIALAYCFASLMIYFFKTRTVIVLSAIFLLGYWAVMMLFGDAPDPLAMTANAGYKIDMALLGPNHLYHGEGIAFDPEGLLSTLPSVVNVVCGFLVGRFLQQKGKTYEGLAKLLLTGAAFMAVAYFWNLVFPVNKKLWTSSFVCLTVGLDCTILSAVIYLVDFRGKTAWTPFFTVLGKNPLFVYLVSELGVSILYLIHVGKKPLFTWLYDSVYVNAGIYFGSLLFAVSWMLFCWLVGYILDRNKIYVRV